MGNPLTDNPVSNAIGDVWGSIFGRPAEMMTDPHSQWLSQQQQQMYGNLIGQQGPTYDPNSPFGQAMLQALGGQSVNAQDWGMMQGQEVDDYFQSTMFDPAVRQYQDTTRPAWLENVSNLHGSHRSNMEQRGYENLYGGLDQQRGNLQYQNLLRNQQMMQQAAGMNQQSQMGAMGLSGMYDPHLQALQMISGQTPTSQVIQGGSFIEQLGALLGGGGQAMSGAAKLM
ncbi:MAG: hypothetical protein MIO92_05240 [Methanosarcinaceae archaeon]|nr:hypothetical protein [Methanosarcinaceae archaeon]